MYDYGDLLKTAGEAMETIKSGKAKLGELDQYTQENGGIENTGFAFQSAYESLQQEIKKAESRYSSSVRLLERETTKINDIPEDVDRKTLTPEWYSQKFEEMIARGGSLEAFVQSIQDEGLDPQTQERVLKQIDEDFESKEQEIVQWKYQEVKKIEQEIQTLVPELITNSQYWISSLFRGVPIHQPIQELARKGIYDYVEPIADTSQLLKEFLGLYKPDFLTRIGLKKEEEAPKIPKRISKTDLPKLEKKWTKIRAFVRRSNIENIPDRLPSSSEEIYELLTKIQKELLASKEAYHIIFENSHKLERENIQEFVKARKIQKQKSAWEAASAPLRAKHPEAS